MSDIPLGSSSTRAPLENLTSDPVRLILKYLNNESPTYNTAILHNQSDISYSTVAIRFIKWFQVWKQHLIYNSMAQYVTSELNVKKSEFR